MPERANEVRKTGIVWKEKLSWNSLFSYCAFGNTIIKMIVFERVIVSMREEQEEVETTNTPCPLKPVFFIVLVHNELQSSISQSKGRLTKFRWHAFVVFHSQHCHSDENKKRKTDFKNACCWFTDQFRNHSNSQYSSNNWKRTSPNLSQRTELTRRRHRIQSKAFYCGDQADFIFTVWWWKGLVSVWTERNREIRRAVPALLKRLELFHFENITTGDEPSFHYRDDSEAVLPPSRNLATGGRAQRFGWKSCARSRS
jgi:hypothetical protein